MDRLQIIAEAENYMDARGPPSSEWTVGTTDDPGESKSAHEREGHLTSRWRHWDAGTENDAREIVLHLQGKGMQGGPGRPGNARYVYVL